MALELTDGESKKMQLYDSSVVETMRNLIVKYESHTSISQAKIHELDRALRSERESNVKLTQALKQQQEQFNDKDIELRSLYGTNTLLRNAKNELEEKNKDYARTIEELRNICANKDVELQDHQKNHVADMLKMRHQILEFQEKNSEMESLLHQLACKDQELQNQQVHYKKMLNQAQESQNKYIKTLSQSHAYHIQGLREEVNQKEAHEAKLKAELERAAWERDQAVKELQSIQQAFGTGDGMSITAAAAIERQAQLHAEQLHDQLHHVRLERDTLTRQLESERSSCRRTARDRDILHDQLRLQLTEKEKKIAALERSLHEAKESQENFQQELERSRQQIHTVRAERDSNERQKHFDMAEIQRDANRKEEALRQQLDEALTKIKRIELQHEQMSFVHKESEKMLKEQIEHERSQREKECGEKNGEIEELQRKVKESSKQNSSLILQSKEVEHMCETLKTRLENTQRQLDSVRSQSQNMTEKLLQQTQKETTLRTQLKEVQLELERERLERQRVERRRP